MSNRKTVRFIAVLVVAVAALVGGLQLTADVAEAAGCSAQFKSCLGWCSGEGRQVYGSYGSCRSACRDMYCNI